MQPVINLQYKRTMENTMHRLIRAGLMFGNLFHVASPALVDRYNRALEHLTGKRTKCHLTTTSR